MDNYNAELDVRMELALGRLKEIKEEEFIDAAYGKYFRSCADTLLMLADILQNENISLGFIRPFSE